MPVNTRTLFVATKNLGKLREFHELFDLSEFCLESYDAYEDVAEGEASYAENASLKSNALARQLTIAGIRACVLGDDSGIEVAALGNRPGVLSARYGPPGITWSERRDLLRGELVAIGARDWSARFVCALHYIDETGCAVELSSDVPGFISRTDAGESGFSYDPAFLYPAANKTFAEMSVADKNRLSARGRAVNQLLARIASAGSSATRKSVDWSGTSGTPGM